MHEMQTIVTDDRSVCRFVSLSQGSTRFHFAGSFGAAFAKSLSPLAYVCCISFQVG